MFWDIYLIAYLLGAMLAMGMQIGEYGNENNRSLSQDFTGVGYKIFWTIVAILLSWITVGLLYQAKRK